MQVAARARLTVAIHQVLLQWGRPLIALGAIMLMGTSPVSAILGYIAASVVVLVSQVVCFLRKSDFAGSVSPVVNTTVTRQWRQRLLSYSTPFATWGVFTWLQIASDRWCLGRFHGMKSVAAFTVSFQLGYLPMILISVAIGQIITPRLFSIAGHGQVAFALRSDLGETIANALHRDDGGEDRIYTLTAGEAWSFDDLARALGKLSGKPVTYTPHGQGHI